MKCDRCGFTSDEEGYFITFRGETICTACYIEDGTLHNDNELSE